MVWLNLVVALLKLANSIFVAVQKAGYVQEGYDTAVAEQSEALLRKTRAGKVILERVNALSDAEVDAGLRDLEPR